ncbi:hypothetical protein ACNKHN_24535 [Shigella flexneri]
MLINRDLPCLLGAVLQVQHGTPVFVGILTAAKIKRFPTISSLKRESGVPESR